jgi:mediator of RNA polymerase II transcription subunit 16, fungi type
MVTYDTSGQMRLHRLKIAWNIDPKQPHPGNIPHLDCRCIRVCEDFSPKRNESELNGVDGLLDRLAPSNQLTHLKVLPTFSQPQREPAPSTILAVFTQPRAASLDQLESVQDPTSVICRWEIHQSPNSLNSAFDQLPSKKKSSSSAKAQQMVRFKRLEDLPLDSALISLHLPHARDQVILCFNTGLIEFRNRDSLEPVVGELKPDRITSLSQAGFSFPKSDPMLNVALSPNFCLAAVTKPDGTAVTKRMESTLANLSADDDDNTQAVVALVLLLSVAQTQMSTAEDLLALFPPNISASKYLTMHRGRL